MTCLSHGLSTPLAGTLAKMLDGWPTARVRDHSAHMSAHRYVHWLRERLTFYSGVAYAEERLCDGTKNGLAVGHPRLSHTVPVLATAGVHSSR